MLEAEILQLTLAHDGSVTWTLFFPERVPIVLYEDEDNHRRFAERSVFHVRADVENSSKTFDEFLAFPGTPMSKTSDCFLQWKETEKGTVWGLKFMLSTDMESFLKVCLSGLTTGQIAHTTSTRALADALGGPAMSEKERRSRGNVGRPASVVESSIDEETFHGIASETAQNAAPEVTRLPSHVESPQEDGGTRIEAAVDDGDGSSDQHAGESDEGEEPECTYIDDVEPNVGEHGSAQPADTAAEQIPTAGQHGGDLAAVTVRGAAAGDAMRSPTDSALLNRDSDLEHLSLNLTDDILSQFPITIVNKTPGREIDLSSPTPADTTSSTYDGEGPTSLLTPPVGFLHSTENLSEPAEYRRGEDDLVSPTPISPPDWVDSGLGSHALSPLHHATVANQDGDSAAATESSITVQISTPMSSDAHEDLRASMYSPGIVPVRSRENLDRIIPAPAMQDAAASPSQDASSSNTAEATGSELPPSGLVSSLKARFDVSSRGVVQTKEQIERARLAASAMPAAEEAPVESGNDTIESDDTATTTYPVSAVKPEQPVVTDGNQVSSEMLPGSVRYSGYLVLKNVIFHKHGRLTSGSRRKWKSCWGVLHGTTLTLYQSSGEDAEADESAPVVLTTDVCNGIAQLVHEYVYRDYVTSLSSSEGHTHYMQASSQTDASAWVGSIHLAAALAATSASTKADAIQDFQSRCTQIQEEIDTQSQMKQMAVLQQKTATGKVKSKISEQISSWSEELEAFNMDLFKWKCYIAALKGSELPNPQNLLACATKATKSSLRGQVATFSVSALHCLVIARRAAKTSNQRPASLKHAKKTGPEPDIVPMKKNENSNKGSASGSVENAQETSAMHATRKALAPLDLGPSESSSTATEGECGTEAGNSVDSSPTAEVAPGQPVWKDVAQPPKQAATATNNVEQTSAAPAAAKPQYLRIELPDKQSTVILLQDGMTAGDVLDVACEKRNLDPDGTFLVLGLNRADTGMEFRLANLDQEMKDMMYDIVEVREKVVSTVHLALPDTRTLGNLSVVFGFEVDICEGAALDQPSVYVTEVLANSVAHSADLHIGDEILSINMEAVEEQTRSRIIELLQAPVLSMVVRSCGAFSVVPDTNLIDELVCPAPPSFVDLTDVSLEDLMVPKPPGEDQPDGVDEDGQDDNFAAVETEQIDKFLQNIEELNAYLLTLQMEAPPVAVTASINHTVSKEKRISMCAQELVDTERHYIKKLTILLDRYLEPLRFETFIPKETLELVFGNIRDVVIFQRQFLQDLEDSLRHIQSADDKASAQSIRLMIFSLSGSVLFYMRRFKMYSSFCVSHMEANLFLNKPESLANEQLQEFLRVRNPKKDSAMSLPALLIMPILRLMRYPLFLETMRSLTVPDSTEHQRLTEAKSGMEHMADYINEMQRINDQFGVLFHQLLTESAFTEPWLSASINDLCQHLEVMWLNANQSLMHGHSWKKGVGPRAHCFVFKTIIVILCEPHKGKRKSTKNLADAPAMQQSAVTMDDLLFWTVVRTSRAKAVDLPDSDGVTDMWQLVNKTTQPVTTYLFRAIADGEKPAAVTTIRQVIRDRNAALTALTPGTARRKLASAQQQGVESGGSGGAGSGAAQQISVTSYSRHHEASTTTRVVSPDSEAGLFTRSAQLRTSNRKRRASECGRSIETAAAAALGASEDYFATEEVNC
ncbi:protein still life, isoform SIF type 1-like isoform X1 [Sycon ciliatum]|uniref:protein still life, isoform SIF type 1-like isoform X1 n=2 Tax=Sycon ciliatum TaxID=27933 RepID=UPI0031F6BB0E